MNRKPSIIALTGLPGSGKGRATEYLCEKYGALHCQFSGPLRDILRRLYQPITRENLQNLALILRETFGEQVLAEVLLRDAENSDKEFIVMEGLRHLGELELLRTYPGFYLVAIDVDMQKRFDRIKKRGENEDDRSLTMEDFEAHHKHPSDIAIAEIMKLADERVDNSGTMADLENQLDGLIAKIKARA